MKIKHRFTSKILAEGETIKEAAVDNKSYLRGANLRGAYLWGAYLRGADLSGADLSGADLRGAYLWGAYLRGADLSGAEIEFRQYPSLRLLSSMNLYQVSDKLTLELMRRDAYAHPNPEKFTQWAEGGNCPYQNEERTWFFAEDKKLWKPGNPTMRDSDLVIAICKEKGWGIRGHLKIKK